MVLQKCKKGLGNMITVYGIPHCDTVKKARQWLDAQGIAYVFHDFKKQGVPEARLDAWMDAAGWEALLNRRGTTWRRLDDATRDTVVDAASAKAVMMVSPSIIKRPVFERLGVFLHCGFAAGAAPILNP